ncbi:MAG TPA: T9SS type A sorting domain-containing protein [Flavilitoribacter sp.]|nr:T9SS type A sorting domain-containing protein [Flavilitoribacter sp.]HMQ86082.1 T9SS type A sorting domain-containing protein [Flavilitoribacter sp.]
MKKSLLIAISVFASVALKAQVSFTIDTVIVQNITPDTSDAAGHSKVKNNGIQVKNFKWERTEIQITDGWQSAVCDKNQCYFPEVATKEFTLGPSEEGTMDVHAYPNNLEGAAVIQVVVTDLVNSNNTATGIYYFNPAVTGTREVTAARVKVYPNPSNGVFTISQNEVAGNIEVFNMAGKRVKAFNYANGDWYDISDLPRGAYFIRLIDKSGKAMVTRLLQKM